LDCWLTFVQSQFNDIDDGGLCIVVNCESVESMLCPSDSIIACLLSPALVNEGCWSQGEGVDEFVIEWLREDKFGHADEFVLVDGRRKGDWFEWK